MTENAESESDPREDAVPTPVPPYEEAPSSTGVVADVEDEDDGEPSGAS